MLRAVAALTVPVYIAWISKRERLDLDVTDTAALASRAAGSLPELVLARMALSFLVVAIVVFRGVEFAVCWAAHETKAPADEA